ncbi:bifunctional D-glycero-beta-D-manno-heptose-7-phosphate kinase/D-glycero-beta-D-manno-heptose 1-phosphate adenylyltransferase HldE [Halorhodospira halochloris]|uniref:bifunctional D-glycero-beta-D-manno-heptose-7-phosphate kinase/D-glycero-beta-D-manno-heptose 1-phosphate adenylyltransferase HldE n=1 Tax=Halorhodospira halochloris TaxID=1052 RepID=UPI001EE84D27|nr:bifunctional D-glycero-beta-D-manno-heptose-7-phosphate kinase/D-glycero-beta-D-manno-heptose 1-phosphate adenylyltransferase HldE [Halorhodospira halochloris]MCG5529756.1 bifunctional D-glycero-beta-D-manno-heptose-7-phosphate kinase/D-glycero-beta-D-manno-heptose 1-phosphate adenylyltransferase HldE [Halorhodospira halochloris]
MHSQLPCFNAVKIAVFGDLMLDRYWYGATARISPEAPVPVVHISDCAERPGGAGNVALNARALGAQVEIGGPSGDDEAADALSSQLTDAGCNCRLHRLAEAATITKLRIISRHQQLLRLDFEQGFPGFDTASAKQAMVGLLKSVDILILSDYAKGALPDPQPLIQHARSAAIPVLIDPKGQNYEKYRGADIITPNLGELEAVVGTCATADEIATKAGLLAKELDLRAVLVTRGEAGMTLAPACGGAIHLPTRAREVFDVTGAGDTVIATLGAALGAGLELADAAQLANSAAGVVVGKLGTATVSPAELQSALSSSAHREAEDRGVSDETSLLAAVAESRAAGETIVMTNGCFDLLHAGHVDYLKRAKQLGDRLVVAINADHSVRQLKGPTRPILPLEQRMAVVAALEAVDWVVPFSEETPERLIATLLPDVLVKGDDYCPEQIAGAKAVTAAGGKVQTLPLLAGSSSSSIIAKIIQQGGS